MACGEMIGDHAMLVTIGLSARVRPDRPRRRYRSWLRSASATPGRSSVTPASNGLTPHQHSRRDPLTGFHRAVHALSRRLSRGRPAYCHGSMRPVSVVQHRIPGCLLLPTPNGLPQRRVWHHAGFAPATAWPGFFPCAGAHSSRDKNPG